MKHIIRASIAQVFLIGWLATALAFQAYAQTTSITYQGKLTDNGNAANGTFDLEFKLFDALTAGTQQGATLTREEVSVTKGVFTVQLDFGAFAGQSNQAGSGNAFFGRDTVSVGALTSASGTHVCINGTVLSTCSSSQRYKQNVQPLSAGLNLVLRLPPVTFDWKERREHDLGLIAEEVAEVEPLLVTRKQDGMIEGVKYDQLTVVLINAVKEQQTVIEQQQLLNAQRLELDALKKMLCAELPQTDFCRRPKP